MGLVLDAGLFTGPWDKAFPSVFLVLVIFWYMGFWYGCLFVTVSLLKFTSIIFFLV